jgi:hypothetical protein
MIASQLSGIKAKRAYLSPKERVAQARLRLLEAIKAGDKSSDLIPLKKRTIGISAIVFSFSVGFIIGFSPSISKAASQEGTWFLRRWLISRMNR